MDKVRVARARARAIPGSVLDQHGDPTTDPGSMYRRPRGALMTFGEHGVRARLYLRDAGRRDHRQRHDAAGAARPWTTTNGMLTIMIDPSRIIDREWLGQEITAMTDYITASPPRIQTSPC